MIERVSLEERAGAVSSLASFNGVRLNTRIAPAEHAAAGGDWCETFPVSADVVALSIGDVSGHGETRSATMEQLRVAIRAGVAAGMDPSETLARVNRFVHGLEPFTYATAVLAFVDTRRQAIAFANAGHPPPLLVDRSGSRYVGNAPPDLPLGVEGDDGFALHTLDSPPEMLFVLYTDGVTEHERLPVRGEVQLRLAALFAYGSSLPSAAVIAGRMSLRNNRDDVAILTASTTIRRPRVARPRPATTTVRRSASALRLVQAPSGTAGDVGSGAGG